MQTVVIRDINNSTEYFNEIERIESEIQVMHISGHKLNRIYIYIYITRSNRNNTKNISACKIALKRIYIRMCEDIHTYVLIVSRGGKGITVP